MLLLLDIGGKRLLPHCEIRQRRADGLLLIVPSLFVNGNKAGKAQTLVAGTEHMSGAHGVNGHGVINGAGHLRRKEAAPDELVELILIGGQTGTHPLRLQLHMGRPDGLVGVLSARLGLEYVVLAVIILASVAAADKSGGGVHSLVGKPQGVGTHIGNQTGGAFPCHVHAFIQLLGDHHGLFRREAQLPGRLLLQGGGGKGRCGIALLLRFFDVGNVEFLPVDVADHRKGLFFIFQLPLLFLAPVAGDKGAGLAHAVQGHVQRPVFLWLERADFVFPVNHQPGGDGLDTACGQTPPNLFPQQRGKLVAHDSVQNPPRLLGVHQIIVDIPGVADGLLDHLLGDFVKGHPLRLPVGKVQQLF